MILCFSKSSRSGGRNLTAISGRFRPPGRSLALVFRSASPNGSFAGTMREKALRNLLSIGVAGCVAERDGRGCVGDRTLPPQGPVWTPIAPPAGPLFPTNSQKISTGPEQSKNALDRVQPCGQSQFGFLTVLWTRLDELGWPEETACSPYALDAADRVRAKARRDETTAAMRVVLVGIVVLAQR